MQGEELASGGVDGGDVSGVPNGETSPISGVTGHEGRGDSGDANNGKVHLQQVMGLHHAIAILVGVVVGSGIFVSPQGVVEQTGSIGAALCIWLVCGVFATLGSTCYAELGTMIKKSGAEYAYIGDAYGSFLSFLYLWVALIVILPCATAIVAITFAEYAFQPFLRSSADCDAPDLSVRLVATSLIALLTAINCRNVSWSTNIQVVFTVTKILSLGTIIVMGLVYLIQGKTSNFNQPFANSAKTPGPYALAFYSGIFSYAGWNCVCYVTEEVKNPYKNIPRAIWISIPLVTVIYCLTNIAYFAVIPLDDLVASKAVAFTFGERTLGPVAWLMPLFVILSTIGGVNGCIYVSSRLCFVGARNGHLPQIFSLLNILYMTPIPSLVFFGSVSILYLFLGKNVYQLITYMSFVETFFVGITVTALLYLRWKQPNRPRPIKISLIVPRLFMLIMLFVLIFPFTSDASECVIGILICLSGIPVYWISQANKPKAVVNFSLSLTKFIQKLCVACKEEY